VGGVALLALCVLFIALGVTMIWKPRFFVMRFVKNSSVRWPRRERPTESDLAAVSDSDVMFWRVFGIAWTAFACWVVVSVAMALLRS
jgi:hypothetical protein